ncbi:hypothetical protein ACFL0Y_01755 [Patescibacteria group bacterium]
MVTKDIFFNHSGVRTSNNSGQILVIVLLLLAVTLTIGLSVVSRSFVDVQISHQEEESARSFSVAEAGLEEALRLGRETQLVVTTEWGDVTANVAKVPLGGGTEFDFANETLNEGEIRTLWLVSHLSGQPLGNYYPVNESITLCWADEDIPLPPPETKGLGIEALVFYETGGNYRVALAGFDRDAASRTPPSNFDDSIEAVTSCTGFRYQKTINFNTDLGIPVTDGGGNPTHLYAMRLRYLYNIEPQPLKVFGSVDLPQQGDCYQSSVTLESGVTTKLEQCPFFEAPPAVFDFVLFSDTGLIK